MADICSYEEARRQRLQENRKRFEDLGISKTLLEITKNKSPVSEPKKGRKHLAKPRLMDMEPRRSSRVRNAVTSYYDEVDIDLPSLRKRSRAYPSSWASNLARPLDEVKVASYEERAKAVKAAEKLQASLNYENPSFVKSMLRSHVYSCFWLVSPQVVLPQQDKGLIIKLLADVCSVRSICRKGSCLRLVLEDENGSEYEAKYISSRTGLSGGWRGFALEHKLDDGDAVVFELVEPERFKVYIVRAHNVTTGEPTENGEENIKATADKDDMATPSPSSGSAAGKKKKKGTSMAATPNTNGGSRRSNRLKGRQ